MSMVLLVGAVVWSLASVLVIVALSASGRRDDARTRATRILLGDHQRESGVAASRRVASRSACQRAGSRLSAGR